MKRCRFLRWSLILVILAAFVAWLEPTRVVWGWLRGEAFYLGRPTSYWRDEMDRWRFGAGFAGGFGGGFSGHLGAFSREPDWLQQKLPQFFPQIPNTDSPPFVSDAAPFDPVYDRLKNDSSRRVRWNARYVMWYQEHRKNLGEAHQLSPLTFFLEEYSRGEP